MEVKQVLVTVFVENKFEIPKYFKLFKFMLGDKVTQTLAQRDYAQIVTESFIIRFYVKSMNQRGLRSHYVLNLTQDVEFEKYVALPMQNIFSFLLKDEKWSELV